METEKDLDLDNEDMMEEEEGDSDTQDVDAGTEDKEIRLDDRLQRFLDQKIGERLARERAKQRRELEKYFGTSDLATISEYYRAGHMVAKSAGKTPREVIERIQARLGSSGGSTSSEDSVLAKEIEQIKALLVDQKEAEVRKAQEQAARKEFGSLFDEYRDDIEEYAEERGISLEEAARVILFPRVKDRWNELAEKRREVVRSRRVESTSEGVRTSGDDVLVGKLTEKMKRIARKQGIPLSVYAKWAKEVGLID